MRPHDIGDPRLVVRLTDQVEQLRRLADELAPANSQLTAAIMAIEETLAGDPDASPAWPVPEHALFQALSEHAPIGMLVIDDAAERILYGNRQFYQLLHLEPLFTEGEACSLSLYQLQECLRSHLLDEEEWLAPVSWDQLHEGELRLIDGRILRYVVKPIYTVDGERLGGSVIIEDITARKQTETMLQQTNAQLEARVHERTAAIERVNERLWAEVVERQRAEVALQREQAFLYAAVEVLPFPILFIDEEYRILLANSAARETIPEPMRETITSLQLLSPETHAIIPLAEGPVARALRGDVVSMCELLVRWHEGCEIPLLVHASPVTLHGEHTAAVIAWQNITPLKEADHAKDEFLAVLSHELLTPLTCILGWSGVVRDALLKPELLPHALEVIERNGRRQKRLVDDLLDLSRIVHGKIFLSREACDLGDLTLQAVENLAQMVNQHSITLQMAPPRTPLPLHADPLRIGQVVTNLLNNALKFTPEGGLITVSVAQDGDQAVFTVRDTGRGIPRDALAGIFNPFKQVQRDEAKGGLGLGLAVVRGIVELHGGQVCAMSDGPGTGSTFTVRLPLAPPDGGGTATI